MTLANNGRLRSMTDDELLEQLRYSKVKVKESRKLNREISAVDYEQRIHAIVREMERRRSR